MKKILTLFLAVLLLPSILGYVADNRVYTDSPNVKVTLLNYGTENELMPNKVEDFKFKIENLATVKAENVELELITEFPFDAKRTGDDVKVLGNLKAYQDNEDALIETMKVFVSPDVTTGQYKLKMNVYINEQLSYKKEFNVNVKSKSTNVQLTDLQIEPKVVVPGSNIDLEFKIANKGDDIVKNLAAKIELLNQELPFTVIETGSEKKVDVLTRDSEETFNFKLVSFNDAIPGFYKIPLRITYEDDPGNIYQQNEIITVVVGDDPKLSYYVETSDNTRLNAKTILSVNLINRGLTKIKFLQIEAEEKENMDLISSDVYYAGNLDSDELTTADFEVYLRGDQTEFSLPIKITYLDFLNREVEIKDTLDFKVNPTVTQEQGGSFGTIVVVLVILAIAFIIYKKKKKWFLTY